MLWIGALRQDVWVMTLVKIQQRLLRWAYLLYQFILLELASCIFAICIVLLLLASQVLPLEAWGIPRYDFLLIGCLLVQAILLLTRLETWREALVIVAFHVLGFALEAFKVAHGSWAYPEEAYTKILDVPLYAGFMYASVGSYIAQAWRRFDLKLEGLPPMWWQLFLAAAAYFNFFTHHYGPDLRYVITGLIVLSYLRTCVYFSLPERTGKSLQLYLPLSLAFTLIGLFVFFAENIATHFGAWIYPHQAGGWQPVHISKILSWTLMVVIAFLIVSSLKIWQKKLGWIRD